MSQRLVIAVLIGAAFWPLLCGIFIYIANHTELLAGFGQGFQKFLAVDGKFFNVFMGVQSVFAISLAAMTGPGLIAPDLTNNALPLYFSRPMSRWEYVLARLMVLGGMLSAITWIPGLAIFGMQVGMAGGDWLALASAARLAKVTKIARNPFFEKIRSTAVVALYNNELAFAHFGYQGEAFSKGGYLERGFNDLKWLAAPPIVASPAAN